MQIGQLARQAGVPIDTVRYYERRGLLAEPGRRPSGYREYTPQDLDRLKFIRRGKVLGFNLQQIHELLRLNADPSADRGQVRALVSGQLGEVERRLAELVRVRDTLAKLVDSCSGRGSVAGCPIIAKVLDAPLDPDAVGLDAAPQAAPRVRHAS